MNDLKELVNLFLCLQCHSYELTLNSNNLRCQKCSKSYLLCAGVPIFLDNTSNIKIFPPDHVSNQMPAQVVSWLQGLDGYSLNIGAGATATKIPRCIELEYAVYKNTDVVGDAHALPFRDNIFEAVIAFNVFEHLRNPLIASKEIFRVLKPGGKVLIHTAFMQPLHEEPVHYYNATKYGVLEWFSAFEIESCQVSWNFNPAFTIAWLLYEVLNYSKQELGLAAYEKLGNTTLRDWSRIWEDPNARSGFLWDTMLSLSQSTQERFAAGFELKATKPF